jgi:hypothetical protein
VLVKPSFAISASLLAQLAPLHAQPAAPAFNNRVLELEGTFGYVELPPKSTTFSSARVSRLSPQPLRSFNAFRQSPVNGHPVGKNIESRSRIEAEVAFRRPSLTSAPATIVDAVRPDAIE